MLGRPDRTYALNAGFSEFLTLGRDGLLRLGQAIAHAQADDGVVRGEVERFIAEVSRDVQDDTTLRDNPELYRLWSLLGDGAMITRVAAVKELAAHPHPAVVRRLIYSLQNDPGPPVRVAVINTLMRLDSTSSVATIGEVLLRDQAQEVQMEAALALIALGLDSARPWLEKAVGRPDLGRVARRVIERMLPGR